ncbi:glycosyltransferase family 4 protein [Thermodesulfobacteriota bacterium]
MPQKIPARRAEHKLHSSTTDCLRKRGVCPIPAEPVQPNMEKLNILLSTESLRPPMTGIGYYTLNLLQLLRSHPCINSVICFPSNAEQITGKEYEKKSFQTRIRNNLSTRFREIGRSLPGTYLLDFWLRSRRFQHWSRTHKHSVYHEPSYILKSYLGPSVVTVHDLSHVHFTEFHPKERVKFLDRRLPKTLKEAAHILTPSYATRDEIIRSFDLSPNKITAIHSGVSRVFRAIRSEETLEVMKKYHLSHKQYILSVATFEPRKNLKGLLTAYQKLDKSIKENMPLVLIGARGWKNSDADSHIRRLVDRGEVRVLGYVEFQELPILYAAATAFAFLSFYEGFGLPLVEAMACGTPVLTSNASCMPEVAGNAAIFANPYDPSDIAGKLSELLENTALQDTLISRGLLRAGEMTWEKCVAKTVEVYRTVA